MSWFSSASEWKQGLSSSVITKIDDLEIQNEKLKKEKNQKQNQIDTLQQALDKKERKIEDEGKRNQSLQKEVECLGRTCETLQEKLTKHGLESNILPLGNNSQINSAPTSSKKILMKRNEELENEKKCLEERLESLSSSNKNNNNNNNYKILSSESQRDNWTPFGGQGVESLPQKSRDNWTPFGGQGVESLPQKSPLKISKKALETSLEISDENPFKTPVKYAPSGFLVQPLPVKSDEAEELEKKLAVALKKIDALEKENHLLLVGNIKPDSTVENDHKERIILKTDEDESVKSAKDLEEKLKMVKSELDCQRENFETSKMRLEDKVKEKQKELMEDTSRFEAQLSTLEQEIGDLKTKFQQQETLSLCNENALQGSLDKIKSQLSAAEKEKALAQNQCGQFETSLARLGKSEEELTKLCSQLKQERDMVKAQVKYKLLNKILFIKRKN
ncbi:hypothetical protein Avbf_13436 [Armadillidium vulgare]|nr:hypothetical protein Avbf_13436 [Armadillidium vulgare]